MSVKELKFSWPNGNKFEIAIVGGIVHIKLARDDIFIDRSQAHLLMLFLQEHLKPEEYKYNKSEHLK